MGRSNPDTSWSSRAKHWAEFYALDINFNKARRDRRSLVLAGHGTRLWVHNGCLMVRGGFTHFPQRAEEQRHFPNSSTRPSRIISIDGSGSISFDAIDWLTRNGVPFIRVNWRGEVQTIFAQTPERKNSRNKADFAEVKSLSDATMLITKKLRNCIDTMHICLPSTRLVSEAKSKIKAHLVRLQGRTPKSLAELLAIEGNVAYAYFSAWQSIPITWSNTKRKPIPGDWYQIGLRSSVTREKVKNRNASHPVNAMLNYAYAVLESQVRMQIIAAGLDPKNGYLHANRPNRDALVFDTMEPLRPIVDRSILDFVRSNTFEPNDFVIRADGVCRLHPDLASLVVTLVLRCSPFNSCVAKLRA